MTTKIIEVDPHNITVTVSAGPEGATGPIGPAPSGKIWLSSAGGWPSTTDGCATPTQNEWNSYYIDLYVAAFDQSSTEYIQWALKMPDDWNGGTITASFTWAVSSGGAGQSARWGLQGRSYGDGEAIDQAWGTAQEVDDTWVANEYHHVSGSTASITLAGTPAAGELVVFRAYADAANSNLGSDALLTGAEVTFTRT